jgi:ABC-2 type transport system permease protein
MSAVEVAPVPEAAPAPAGVLPRPRPLSTRFFRSELWLIFGRRRNWVGLAILAVVPVVIAVATKLSHPDPGAGTFIGEITNNGVFVALTALTLEMPLFLPLAVAAISGDSIAGEANLGTLRYLLAVPVNRTRMLAVKYTALVVFAAAATLVVAVVGAGLGLALFGPGPFQTLSGEQLPFVEGLWRLLLVCGYITVCLSALAAIGLFASTLTEQPIGAAIAVLMLAIASQILGVIPQLHAIHEYLPTYYWTAYGDLLREPLNTSGVRPGLVSAAVYTVIFLSAAWARFASRDVTS